MNFGLIRQYINKRRLVFVFVVALVMVIIRFYPFIFGKTLYFGDNYSLQVPGKIFTAQWLRKGVLPLWNPTIFAGIPWISEINQSVLYPSTLFFAVFSPAIALNLSLIGHLVFTFIGMYVLARKLRINHTSALLAGILWTFSTQVTGSLNNLSTIQSLAWFPWIVFWGLRVQVKISDILWFGIFITLQFLGGYPQHVMLAILTAVILSYVFKNKKVNVWIWLKRWIVTAMITGLLSAIAWLPFAQSLLDSTRVEQSFSQAQSGSLNPAMIMKAVLPYVFDMPWVGMKWGPAWSGQPNMFMYVTWFGLLILGYSLIGKKGGKRDQVWWWLIVGSVIFSLGEYLPGYEFIQRLLPIFHWGRYPSMLMIVANLAGALWIATVFEKTKISRRAIKMGFGLSILSLILGVILWWTMTSNPNWWWHITDDLLQNKLSFSTFHTLDRDVVIGKVIGAELVIVAIFTMMALFFYRRKMFGWVVLVIFLDLLVHTQGNLFFASNQIYDVPSNTVIEKVRMTLPQYRLITRNSNKPYTDFGMYWESMVVRKPFSDSFIDQKELNAHMNLKRLSSGLTPDWNMPLDIPTIHGYTALLPNDYAKIWSNDNLVRINFLPFIDINSELVRQWSVGYYLVDSQFALYDEEFPYDLVVTDGSLRLYRLNDTLPRFRYIDGKETELIDFYEDPNTIQFFVDNNEESTLIQADRYDADWKAWVNDVPVAIGEINGMRQIEIPPGKNFVTMRYRPTLFYLGLLLSFIGLTAGVGLSLSGKKPK